MKLAVFGTGYVGLVTGTCFAELGSDVTCVDIDAEKIENLKKGVMPIYEPGLEELVVRNAREGRLHFTVEAGQAICDAEVIFIAVGTPYDPVAKAADLRAVFAVAEQIAAHLDGFKIVVNKSTVPVGTGPKIKAFIESRVSGKGEVAVVSNPEFLREGEAILDFMQPDRVVVGLEDPRAKEVMHRLYKGVERTDKPVFFTDIASAELIKYASNTMLASRISFMNELSHLCEKAGADIKAVAHGMGLDKRIGTRFLQAGVGYGGSCFPKDIQALARTMKDYGCYSLLIDAIEQVNHEQKQSLFPKIIRLLNGVLTGKTIAVMGLAFKPKTDDMREAPSIEIIRYLVAQGARVRAFDPVAMNVARRVLHELPVEYAENAYAAVTGADLAVFVTEWNEFRLMDPARMADLMRSKKIVDGRNIFDPESLRAAGFQYIGVGRVLFPHV